MKISKSNFFIKNLLFIFRFVVKNLRIAVTIPQKEGTIFLDEAVMNGRQC